jgi:hypothetical protein
MLLDGIAKAGFLQEEAAKVQDIIRKGRENHSTRLQRHYCRRRLQKGNAAGGRFAETSKDYRRSQLDLFGRRGVKANVKEILLPVRLACRFLHDCLDTRPDSHENLIDPSAASKGKRLWNRWQK